MSAFFAVVMTFLELALTGYAFFTRTQGLFSDMVINGAPFYLVMNLFNPGSPFIDGKPIYMVFFGFHVVKYFAIFRAKILDEHPGMALTAIFFEIAYLSISAYYLY